MHLLDAKNVSLISYRHSYNHQSVTYLIQSNFLCETVKEDMDNTTSEKVSPEASIYGLFSLFVVGALYHGVTK